MYKLLYIFLISLIVSNCSLKPVVNHHGVPLLEKKQENLVVNQTNKNDIKKILGIPSTKSKFDNDIWIYIEKKFYNIKDMKKLNVTENITTSEFQKNSFIYDFLSSMRQKLNDPLGVRAKKRKEISQR